MGYGVPDSGVDFVYITAPEAYALMKNDKAVFVDGRDDSDYEATRIQTSFHLPANDLIMKTRIDKGLIKHLLELCVAGKTIIAVSDSCITGARNRGHVSRCRHVAQYLVELGADRTRVVRMTGGINAWKKGGFDGILGDHRPMFAGSFKEKNFEPPAEEDEELEEMRTEASKPAITDPSAPTAGSGDQAASQEPLELGVGCKVEVTGLKSRADLNGKMAKVLGHIEDAGRWEVEMLDDGGKQEHVRCKSDNLVVRSAASKLKGSNSEALAELRKISVCCGGDVSSDGEALKTLIEVIDVPPRPLKQDTPTAYRVLRGELYKKPSTDSDKIIKLDRPVSAIVRTTGEVFEGTSGGKWAELDVTAGEKKGWIYIEGPGFGPSSRKIRTQFLQA